MFNEHLMIHLEYKISSESLVLLFKPISQSDSSHSSIKYFFFSVKNKALEASQGMHSDMLNLLALSGTICKNISVMQDRIYK